MLLSLFRTVMTMSSQASTPKTLITRTNLQSTLRRGKQKKSLTRRSGIRYTYTYYFTGLASNSTGSVVNTSSSSPPFTAQTCRIDSV